MDDGEVGRGRRRSWSQRLDSGNEEEVEGNETRVRCCFLSRRRRIKGGGDRAGLSLVMCVLRVAAQEGEIDGR